MGASSSGLLDEAKISHVKGVTDSTFQGFGGFYRQQYSSAYVGYLHQEVEPKKEGRGLLLTRRPECALEELLYQGNVKFSCWDEQGKKFRERYAVLRRDYRVEIHENKESFNRGCAAKLVLRPTGGSVLTSEQESRAHLEEMCSGILNGVKEDSSSVVSSPDATAVYLHLPYTGHAVFLFQQEEERDRFLSALKTCIRHHNLDPWCESSYQSQAYTRALRLYRQDKGCYDSWDMLLGTEEEVLSSQVMEEVLPWLRSQLQSRVKGKKPERIRQWLATVHATYTLVLEQLTASMKVLREECGQTASANQAMIRSNLDQIMSSLSFLEQKVRVCIHEEAEKVYCESVAPYMSSILEVLTENISAGIHGMQQTLHTQMDSAFTHTHGGTEDTEKALLSLRSISLDRCYRQVKNLPETLADLKQRFGWSSTQRLVHSAHLEMEQLLDSAVYTLELFLQASARLQPAEIPGKMERAKERVLKQLDYDSRVVQRRLYQEALLEITLPALTRRMDTKWKTESQQFEQYIFSDYSSFIVIHNVYVDVLKNILSTEIETVVQDAAGKSSHSLLLDMSDLAVSEYSLLGQGPPCSAADGPAAPALDGSSPGPSADPESAPAVKEEAPLTAPPQSDAHLSAAAESDPSSVQSSERSTLPVSPVIVVTQEFDEPSTEVPRSEEIHLDPQPGTDTPPATDSTTADSGTPDHSIIQEPTDPTPVSSESSVSSSLLSTDVPAECAHSDRSASSGQTPEDALVLQPCCPSPAQPFPTGGPTVTSLESLNEAISCNGNGPTVTVVQQTTDRAVYLTGDIHDSWEVERVKEETQAEEEEEEEEEKTEGRVGDGDKGSELEKTDQEEAGEREEHTGKTAQEEEVEEEQPQSPQPMERQSSAEPPGDSVAIIRELVTEVTEVEMAVSPCPNSNAP